MIVNRAVRYVSFFIAVVLSITVYAVKKSSRVPTSKSESVKSCEQRPEFLVENKTEISGGIKNLPNVLLVGRKAELYVEGVNSDGSVMQIHSEQVFVNSSSHSGKVLCATNGSNIKQSFSLNAPTIIDHTNTKKIGNSTWQFQVAVNEGVFSVWNLPTKLGNKLEKDISNYRLYQTGHDQFELITTKEIDGVMHFLSVKFDAVKSIN